MHEQISHLQQRWKSLQSTSSPLMAKHNVVLRRPIFAHHFMLSKVTSKLQNIHHSKQQISFAAAGAQK
jgi:hypothetical protein